MMNKRLSLAYWVVATLMLAVVILLEIIRRLVLQLVVVLVVVVLVVVVVVLPRRPVFTALHRPSLILITMIKWLSCSCLGVVLLPLALLFLLHSNSSSS
jgi:hypothetical protein